MGLSVAVQMDPIERINIHGDSTFALLLEAQARGHTLAYYTPDRLALCDGHVFTTAQPLEVVDRAGSHFTLGEAQHPGGQRSRDRGQEISRREYCVVTRSVPQHVDCVPIGREEEVSRERR